MNIPPFGGFACLNSPSLRKRGKTHNHGEVRADHSYTYQRIRCMTYRMNHLVLVFPTSLLVCTRPLFPWAACQGSFNKTMYYAYVYRGPKISKSLTKTGFSVTTAAANLRLCKVPSLACVTILSATLLNSFALAVVVMILSCLMRDVTILRSIAQRCSLSRPSWRYVILFLIFNWENEIVELISYYSKTRATGCCPISNGHLDFSDGLQTHGQFIRRLIIIPLYSFSTIHCKMSKHQQPYSIFYSVVISMVR